MVSALSAGRQNFQPRRSHRLTWSPPSPETMLRRQRGRNPSDDERYADLVGKHVIPGRWWAADSVSPTNIPIPKGLSEITPARLQRLKSAGTICRKSACSLEAASLWSAMIICARCRKARPSSKIAGARPFAARLIVSRPRLGFGADRAEHHMVPHGDRSAWSSSPT